MAFQGGRNLYVNYKAQTTAGTLPSASSAMRFRVNEGSQGLNLAKATINSGENRGDGMSTRGRHGSHNVQGSFATDMSVGSHDSIYEALLRGTWTAAATFTQTDFTSVAVASSVITIGSGSLLVASRPRVGDIITFSAGIHADDLNKRLRITAIGSATTMTVERIDGTAMTDSSTNTTFSFVVARKLIQGTTRRAFAVEEHEIDIDASEVYDFCRFSRMDIALSPDNMGVATFGLVGRTGTTYTAGNAPYFTSPTTYSTLGLASVEAKIKLGSATLTDITDFQLSLDLRAAGQPVVGSQYTPDIFENNAQITARITGLREDFTRFTDFLNETRLELHLFFGENEAAPQDFIAMCVTNLTLANPSKSPLGQDGPRTQSYDLMIGADDTGGAYDQSMIKIMTSAA